MFAEGVSNVRKKAGAVVAALVGKYGITGSDSAAALANDERVQQAQFGGARLAQL